MVPHQPSSMSGGGGGGGGEGGVIWPMFQLLMVSPNSLKSQIPYVQWGWGGVGGGGVYLTHVPIFDAESKSANILNSLCLGWGEGCYLTQVPTFDAESKSAIIQNSLSWKFCWKISKFFDKKCAIQVVLGEYKWSLVHYVYAGP